MEINKEDIQQGIEGRTKSLEFELARTRRIIEGMVKTLANIEMRVVEIGNLDCTRDLCTFRNNIVGNISGSVDDAIKYATEIKLLKVILDKLEN